MSFHQEFIGPIPFWKSRLHGRALENMLMLTRELQDTGVVDNFRKEASACMEFIDNRVIPHKKLTDSDESYDTDSYRFQVMSYFLESTDWKCEPEVQKVFSSYVEIGFINVNQPSNLSIASFKKPVHSSYLTGSLPLEIAIMTGNLSALDLLLGNDADVTLVPSPKYFDHHSRPEKNNILNFISLFRRDEFFDLLDIEPGVSEETDMAMRAMITKWLMFRRLRLLESNTSISESSTLSAARRRMGGL